MAAKKAQQIGIIVITVALVIGTIGSFAVMVLTQNEQSDLARQMGSIETKIKTLSKEHQDVVDQKINDLYFDKLKQYLDYPNSFALDSVNELSSEVLEAGDGDEIKDDTNFSVLYIGWDANGHIFDSSFSDENTKLKAPFDINGLKDASVIEGWKKGLLGQKLGSVNLLSIPSDLAYGESGSGDIPANMPIKFITISFIPPVVPDSPEMQNALDEYMKLYEKANQ